jgi:hypothetical protein
MDQLILAFKTKHQISHKKREQNLNFQTLQNEFLTKNSKHLNFQKIKFIQCLFSLNIFLVILINMLMHSLIKNDLVHFDKLQTCFSQNS